jgi:hypothetical protein
MGGSVSQDSFAASKMKMIDATADKLLLLLSTDWFAPYWPSIGLWVNRDNKHGIQRLLRAEAQRVFVGRTYWHAAFDSARLEATSTALLSAFENYGEIEAGKRLVALIGREPSIQEPAKEAWLLSTMTEMLADSGDESLPAELLNAVRAAWSVAQIGSRSWRDICEKASAEWDAVIQRLTPDLTCWLADFVAVEIQDIDSFGLFWSDFRQLQTEQMVNRLKDWYRTTAHSLTGEAIELRCAE